MAFNGSGTFNLYTPGTPFVTGTAISSTVMNAVQSDIATGLSTVICKDGQTTVTANIPLAGFKLTGLGAGAANGDAIRWQQSAAGVMTTLGDGLYASAANTPARIAAAATVAAHATTMNLWVASQVTLSGGAVTITDIADAPYAGAVVWVKQNAAHVWTHGTGVFDIQGAANYTAAAGDWIRVYALSVSTFAITIFKQSGQCSLSTPSASFTPVVAFGGASVGVTYGTQTGNAQFDGTLASFSINIVLTSKGSSTGALTITGLPFTCAENTVVSLRITGLAAGIDAYFSAVVNGSGTTISIQQLLAGSATIANVLDSDVSDTLGLIVSGQYLKS